jgi:hypothetical protein
MQSRWPSNGSLQGRHGANTAMVPSLATMPLAMVLLLLSMLGESHSAAPHILFMLVGSRTFEAPAYWRCALPRCRCRCC